MLYAYLERERERRGGGGGGGERDRERKSLEEDTVQLRTAKYLLSVLLTLIHRALYPDLETSLDLLK